MMERARRLYVVGMMGAGKSTVGRRLSLVTGWRYVDNDALIEAATGRTAPEIVAEAGPDALHAAELAAFEHGAALPTPVIIGVAGFVVMDDAARQRMRETGTVIWLRASPETLLQRVGSGAGRRPAATSLSWIREMVERRTEVYTSVADVIVDVDEMRPRSVVAAIVERLELPIAS